ncbi:hypothetical protein GCM10027570_55760 [Streptomonospora sediminis]
MPIPFSLKDDDPAEIGGLRLIGRLGTGGQGTVYLAEPGNGGAPVAVKCLNPEALEEPRVRQRFIREAEAARQVASFCTAAVLAADFEAESPYIVSEYVEGRSLSQRIRQDGPMSGGDLSRLAVATATALVAIHEAGIVHRDFKPGNVLLGDGGARVIDFGIAQSTESSGTLTNSPIGTPPFMAPEQIAGGFAVAASDVFAWGAVLVYAATGASPFSADTVPNVLHKVLHTEPDLSALPDELRPLAAKALDKDPAARPNSVDVLMALLGRQGRSTDPGSVHDAIRAAHTAVVGGDTTAPATFTTTQHPPSGGSGAPAPKNRRRPWLVGIGAVLAVGLLTGVAAAGAVLGNALGPLDTSAAGSGHPTAPQTGGGGSPEPSASGGTTEATSGDEGAAPKGGGNAGAEAGAENATPENDTSGAPDETAGGAPAGQPASIYDVAVGDCFNDYGEDDTTDVYLIDCAEPHKYELYAAVQLDGDRAWPGDTTVGEEADVACRGEAFTSYVGVGYMASDYYELTYTPTESGWQNGDYEVLCAAYSDAGATTGSIAGTAQ